jgi:hypothetical protein
MKAFAHWKTIQANQGFTAADGSHQRDVIELRTGPGLDNPIQFIVEIPDGVTRDEVVAKWVLECGARVDDATDGLGFEKEWPEDVRRQFHDGTGVIHKWPALP